MVTTRWCPGPLTMVYVWNKIMGLALVFVLSPWFPRKVHSPLSPAVILAGLSKKPFGSASAN